MKDKDPVLVNFIGATNTLGAGLRWLSRYEAFLQKSLFKTTQIKLYHNFALNTLKHRCICFIDWIIAFSVHPDFILAETRYVYHESAIKVLFALYFYDIISRHVQNQSRIINSFDDLAL